jgi:hypothetical protein
METTGVHIPNHVASVLLTARVVRVRLWDLASGLHVVEDLTGMLLGFLRSVGVLEHNSKYE